MEERGEEGRIANLAWESQEGYDPERRRLFEEEEGSENKERRKRRRKEEEEREKREPEGWRTSYGTLRSRMANVRVQPLSSASNKHADDIDSAKITKEWSKMFEERQKSDAKKKIKTILEDFALEDSVDAFDEEIFRDKVQMVYGKLKEALKSGDIAMAARHFEYLSKKLQPKIPAALDRLHVQCRACWIEMMHVYVEHGEYEQVKQHLDMIERVYGMHTADRAIVSVRHFMSKNDADMAMKFWKDAEKDGVLDERSYADVISWLCENPRFSPQTRSIIHSALSQSQKVNHDSHLRSSQTPSMIENDQGEALEAKQISSQFKSEKSGKEAKFELTIHFYNAALQFFIMNGEAKSVKEMMERLWEEEEVYGLGPASFASWFRSSNAFLFSHTSRIPFIVSKDKESRSLDLDRLLSVHQSMFEEIFGLFERKGGIFVADDIRAQILRSRLLQSNHIDHQHQIISEFSASHSLDTLNALIEVALLRLDLSLLSSLLDDPLFAFPPPSSSSPTHIPSADASSYAIISSTLDSMFSYPYSFPGRIASSSLSESSIFDAINTSPVFSSLTPLLGSAALTCWKRTIFALFSVAFLRPSSPSHLDNPPPKIVAKVISALLEVAMAEQAAYNSISCTRPAIQSMLEWMYSRSTQMIPDDKEHAYSILSAMQKLKMREASDFLKFCMTRMSAATVAGLISSRICYLRDIVAPSGMSARRKEVEALWKYSLEKGYAGFYAPLVIAYAQVLARSPMEDSMKGNMKASVALLALALDDSFRPTPKMFYEMLQLMGKIIVHYFDVPALWAMEEWRRQNRIPLTSNIASLFARIITHHGDKYIQSNVVSRLSADFDAYIVEDLKQRHFFDSLDSRSVSLFENSFMKWKHLFLKAVPTSHHVITSLRKKGVDEPL